MLEYTLVTNSDQGTLIKSVNANIAMGWIPLGGISITTVSNISNSNTTVNTIFFSQAMTRLSS